MAQNTWSDRLNRLLGRGEATSETATSEAQLTPVSHGGEFFIRRESEAGVSFAGPFDTVADTTPTITLLREGSVQWSDFDVRNQLPALERWPIHEGLHQVDVIRHDGGFRVTVERRPQKMIREGEVTFEPGLRARSNDLYPSEAEAQLAATGVVGDLRRHGQFDEALFEVEDIERAPERTRMQTAPVQSAEFRSYRTNGPSPDRPPAPFRLRDAMPRRTDPFFLVHKGADGQHHVVFDGNSSMSITPPQRSLEQAEGLARQLNALQSRGARIDFKHYGFGRTRPSDRRLIIADINGQSQVLFIGNRSLGRSRPMDREAAESLRTDLAQRLRAGARIDWGQFGFQWGRHPDRLTVLPMHGSYRLAYEARDKAGISDIAYATEADANRALDETRRQLFRGETVDMRGWDFHRTAKSMELRVRQGDDRRFQIVTGTGRVFHQSFGDFAEAEATQAKLTRSITQGDMIPEGDQWIWPDKMAAKPFSALVESEIARLQEAIATSTATHDLVVPGIDVMHRELRLTLDDLLPAEEAHLKNTLGQFGEVKAVNETLRELNRQLGMPEYREPILDPGNRAIRLDLLSRRDALDDRLDEFPRESKLAGDIARALKGKHFEPEELTASITGDRPRMHARVLLDQYKTVQEVYMPRSLLLAVASQRAGVAVRRDLLGDSASKWLGTTANMAPPQFTGILGALRQSIRTTQRALQPERAAGLSH